MSHRGKWILGIAVAAFVAYVLYKRMGGTAAVATNSSSGASKSVNSTIANQPGYPTPQMNANGAFTGFFTNADGTTFSINDVADPTQKKKLLARTAGF